MMVGIELKLYRTGLGVANGRKPFVVYLFPRSLESVRGPVTPNTAHRNEGTSILLRSSGGGPTYSAAHTDIERLGTSYIHLDRKTVVSDQHAARFRFARGQSVLPAKSFGERFGRVIAVFGS